MQWFRVTKYDPGLRTGPGDSYPREEWTSMSDIGRCFDGHVLDRAEYLGVESAYLDAVRAFAAEAGAGSLLIRGLEWHATTGVAGYREGQRVPIAQAVEVVRGMLREGPLWCRLEDDDRLVVHVGYDYYLYIGTRRVTDGTLGRVRESGLFVEPGWTSPYLDH
jgi:small subunit ribosomal protein S1